MKGRSFGVCGWPLLLGPIIEASGSEDRARHAGLWAVFDPLTLARTLRRQQTRAEQLLWSRLRNRQQEGCKFRRQQVIGPDIVDFLSVQPKLVIEVDGGQHAETTLQDAQRTEYLQRRGYQVVRYWNDPVVGTWRQSWRAYGPP
jgi:very-short-patch-repair endonuclease